MFVDDLSSTYKELGMNVNAKEFRGTLYLITVQEIILSLYKNKEIEFTIDKWYSKHTAYTRWYKYRI